MRVLYCKEQDRLFHDLKSTEYISGATISKFCASCKKFAGILMCKSLFICILQKQYNAFVPYEGEEFNCDNCSLKFKCYTQC